MVVGMTTAARMAVEMTTLTISEMFGPTVQGEGPTAGTPCVFLRTSNCNLDCRWCDTPFTWDWDRYDKAAEQTTITVNEAFEWLNQWDVPLVVISGGEPLLQQVPVDQLTRMLVETGRRVEIETNGTIPPTRYSQAFFNVSPKLAHAQTTKNPIRKVGMSAFSKAAQRNRAIFKFVAAEPRDLDEVDALVLDYDIPADKVWIMPLGTSAQTVTECFQRLADPVVSRGYHLTSRLHVLAWGDKRGH